MYTRVDRRYHYIVTDDHGERVTLYSSDRVAIAYTNTDGVYQVFADGPPNEVYEAVQRNNALEDVPKVHTYIFGDNAPIETINKAIEDPSFLALLINA